MNHMKMMDQNGDGKISQQEFTAFHEKRFQQMDANGDGYVTSQEFSAGMAARRRNMMSTPAQQGNPPRQDQEQQSPQQ